MNLDDLHVEVRDSTLTRVGVIIPEDLDFQGSALFNNVGLWVLNLPTEHPMVPILRSPGAGIIVEMAGQTLISGPVLKATFLATSDDPDGSWSFDGATDDLILADMLAWPQPSNADFATQAVDQDTRTGAAETLMHEFIDANIGPSAPAGRRKPGLTLGADSGHGAVVTKSARFAKLGEVCNDLSLGNDLGFRVIQRGTGLVFETYVVRDLTKTIRLDVRNNTLQSEKLQLSAPEVTRALVVGGKDTARTYLEVTTSASLAAEAAWDRRIEVFVSETGKTDPAELTRDGDEALADKGDTGVAVEIVPMDGETMQIGRDWAIGDKVAAVIDTEELASVVTGIAVRADMDGFQLSATMGDPTGFDPSIALRRRVQETGKRLSALERNT